MPNRISPDRIRFFLTDKNFRAPPRSRNSSSFSKETMTWVVWNAFALSEKEFNELIAENPMGFHIVCRPSQYGRFITYRAKTGEGINSIVDLKAEIVKYEPTVELTDAEYLTKRLQEDGWDIGHSDVSRVLQSLDSYHVRRPKGNPTMIDVSDRHHVGPLTS